MSAKKTSTPAQKKRQTTKPRKAPSATKPAPAELRDAPGLTLIDVAEIAQILHVLETHSAALPPLDAPTRAAFRAQFNDVKCAQLGETTKAPGVLREVAAHVVQIHGELDAHGAHIDGYEPLRLAWLVECAIELGHKLETQIEHHAGARATKSTVARGETSAREVRRALLATFGAIVGHDDDDAKAAVAAAAGSPKRAAEIPETLYALAKLGAAWLASTDPTWKIRCKSAGLTNAKLDKATAVASALALATGAKIDAGPARPNDTAEVNAIEGRVVYEIGHAIDAFAAARTEWRDVAALSAGPATRHALVHPKRAAAAGVAATTPSAAASSAAGKSEARSGAGR